MCNKVDEIEKKKGTLNSRCFHVTAVINECLQTFAALTHASLEHTHHPTNIKRVYTGLANAHQWSNANDTLAVFASIICLLSIVCYHPKFCRDVSCNTYDRF